MIITEAAMFVDASPFESFKYPLMFTKLCTAAMFTICSNLRLRTLAYLVLAADSSLLELQTACGIHRSFRGLVVSLLWKTGYTVHAAHL
jgi:hypothetical protein